MIHPAVIGRCCVVGLGSLWMAAAIGAETGNVISVPGSLGLYRKVIVCEDDALLRQPDGSEVPVAPFSIFFQLAVPTGRPETEEWVTVGDSDGTVFGNIRKTNVVEWNTRCLLLPNPPQGDAKFTVRATEPRTFTATYDGGGAMDRQTIAPILRVLEGAPNPECEVAFFAGKVEPVGGRGVLSAESVKAEDTKLEVVFVIDTTASMTPLIESLKQVARRCVAQLAGDPQARAAMRFGLVQYRDSTPGLGFVAKLDTPLADVADFEKAVRTLAAAETGSEETAEDVLAGLLTAIEMGGWSENSSKHIVLLGDASAHVSGPKNTTGLSIESLLDRAQENAGGELKRQLNSKFIHVVRGIQAGDPDGPICEEQFKKLAANRGRSEGLYIEADPTNQMDSDDVIRNLRDALRCGFAGVAAMRTGNAEKLEHLAVDGGETAQLAQAQWRIVVAAGSPPIRVVERGIARLRDEDGQLLAQPAVIISHDDLSRIESTLRLIGMALTKRVPRERRGDLTAIVRPLQAAVAAAIAGQELDPDVPLDDVIASLPLRPRILRTKPSELAAMSAEDFERWLEGLKDAQEHAGDLLHEQAHQWVTVSDKAANSRFACVLIDDLP